MARFPWIPCLFAVVLATDLSAAQASEQAVLGHPTQLPVLGEQPTGITVGDFDGDGAMDIAVSNRMTSNLSVFMGLGDGTLLDAVVVQVGATPRYVEAIDVDADGLDELVSTDYDDSTLSLVKSVASVSPEVSILATMLRPAAIDVGDVDGDGDEDLVVVHWDENSENPSQSPALCTVLINDGLGDFTVASSVPVGVQPRCVRLVDLDGDTDLDALVCNLASDDLTLLDNDGSGGLVPTLTIATADEPRFATAADLDGDGDTDFAVVHKSLDQMIVHFQDPTGEFTPQEPIPTGKVPHGITHARIGADEQVDLIVADLGVHRVRVFANIGDGNFEESCATYSPACPADVAAVDLDLDGWTDIVSANSWSDTMNIHLNISDEVVLPCPSDLDESGEVDVIDLLLVIGAWGDCPPHETCEADFNLDGTVDVIDLLQVLGDWGGCP